MVMDALISATHTDVLRKKSINIIFNNFCEILLNHINDINTGDNLEPIQIFNEMESFLKKNMVVFSTTRTASTSFIDEDLGESLYAMCALADELFLNINWDGKAFWEAHLLEAAFFSSHVSGELIFKRIDNLLLEGNALFSDLAEVYLKMLALGFMGKFRGEIDSQEIANYRNKLYQFIVAVDHSAEIRDFRLFDEEYTNSVMQTVQVLLPDPASWNRVISFGMLGFIIFGILYWFFNTSSISAKMDEIEEIAIQEVYE